MTNCKTPGLRIDWRVSTYGNNLYAILTHAPSGNYIRKFTHAKIEGGKRRFAAMVDAHVGHIDWTRSVEALTADAADIRNAVYQIPYNCREKA